MPGKKTLKILHQIPPGSKFWKDIDLVKTLTDEELEAVASLAIDIFPSAHKDIKTALKDKVSSDHIGHVVVAQTFFLFLIQEGIEYHCRIEDFKNELMKLGFSEEFGQKFIERLEPKKETLLMERELTEPDITPDLCRFEWRIINITADVYKNDRDDKKIELCFIVHTYGGEHAVHSFEITPEQLIKIEQEINVIKGILNA